MAFKKWVVSSPERELAKELAEECEIDPFVALIAAGRGYHDPAELEQLISEELQLCDPRELADITTAAAAVNEAISSGVKIAIFGDYDCDGVTASALLYLYLTKRGAQVICYIPDRMREGYGMNCAAIEQLKQQGVGLIVTVDNGIACAEEIAYATSLGIPTVVTDHHLPPAALPDAVAVVDPHRDDCPSSFKEICGATVAFKLVCVLEDKAPEELLSEYADLLCLATIGDVMPLTEENRSIVRMGLRMMKSAPRVGISALLQIAGIDRHKLKASNISFGLTPRINAAGRMGDAARAFRLLISSDMLEALNIAGELDEENAARQKTEQQITAEACAAIEKNGYQYDRVIVVAGDGWHAGVVGIAAARIAEKYGKPAFVLSIEGDEAHGSGRSIEGFSLYGAVAACKEELSRFGGHESAAGVSLKREKIEDFRRAVNDYAAQIPAVPPKLQIDLRLNPSALTVDMADALAVLEPYGNGNPAPLFGLFGVTLQKITSIGSGKHLRLMFSRGETVFQALLFGVTAQQFCFETGDVLDLAVQLESNLYQGVCSLSVMIRALRMSGVDEEALFDSLYAYHDYLAGRETDVSVITPSRAEVGEIYRLLRRASIGAERLKYLCLSSPGYAKTQVALTVLRELELVRLQDGKYSGIAAEKTQLERSETYHSLLKKGEQT